LHEEENTFSQQGFLREFFNVAAQSLDTVVGDNLSTHFEVIADQMTQSYTNQAEHFSIKYVGDQFHHCQMH